MSGVSFVVTVYNKAPYLKDMIGSLRAQSGAFEREYIFIDDGSRDESLAVLEAETAGLPNCTVRSQPNGGQARASNAGFALARLDFIKPVDADDILHAACTERLLAAHAGNPGAALAYCNQRGFLDGDPPPDMTVPVRKQPVATVRSTLRMLFRSVMANPTQILVRTAALRASGGADERVAHSMEYGLMLGLALQGAFLHVPEILAFQRLGLTGNLSSNQRLTLQESMRAPAHFIRDHPEIAGSLKRYVAQRAAGRAWLWALRKKGAGPFSKPSLRRLEALIPQSDYPAFLERCADSLND